MKKFSVKFVREFDVEIEAESTALAETYAQKVIGQFPKDSCKLLSVIAVDAAEGGCPACQEHGPIKEDKSGGTKGGPPNLGGSSGGTVVKLPVLVDQIAEAA